MGLKLTFLRPDHLSPSFTSTMNKFSLVTCEGVKAAVISPRSKYFQSLPELHELGLQSILTLRPRLKAQTITIANKMKKNYVDKSYMNTKFTFGYFYRLALRKLN